MKARIAVFAYCTALALMIGTAQGGFYPEGLARSARPRRYVFHDDEIAEAEAQGLPYMLAPRVLSREEWEKEYCVHEDRTPTHGYAETREAAMAAFAKSWRRA
jgi:hypothetical protein